MEWAAFARTFGLFFAIAIAELVFFYLPPAMAHGQSQRRAPFAGCC